MMPEESSSSPPPRSTPQNPLRALCSSEGQPAPLERYVHVIPTLVHLIFRSKSSYHFTYSKFIPFFHSVPFHFASQFHSILFLFPLLFCSHSIPGICAVGGCTHHCEHIGLCPPRGYYHLPPGSHQHHPPPNHHRRFPPRVFREPYSEVDTSKRQWGG